jgi:hypothetical protein
LIPAIVFPFHNPDGSLFPHLQAVAPALKGAFTHACLSIPPDTRAACPGQVRLLEQDGFFRVHFVPQELPVGSHFHSLYTFAAASGPPEQVLHLCFPDRLAFALQTRHREQFLADMASLDAAATPLIFQRSPAAWQTHPRNYAAIENFITTAGELLLGRSLDFAWCHLAIQAARLAAILPAVRRADMSMIAEIALLCLDDIQTREVDWLEWEDPFFAAVSAGELRREREASPDETRKRLAYALPMVEEIVKREDVKREI